jgi:hypothetical protein
MYLISEVVLPANMQPKNTVNFPVPDMIYDQQN